MTVDESFKFLSPFIDPKVLSFQCVHRDLSKMERLGKKDISAGLPGSLQLSGPLSFLRTSQPTHGHLNLGGRGERLS